MLVTLGIGDALGDSQARDWARKQLALDYVGVAHAQARGKKGSQAVLQMEEAS